MQIELQIIYGYKFFLIITKEFTLSLTLNQKSRIFKSETPKSMFKIRLILLKHPKLNFLKYSVERFNKSEKKIH